MSHLPVYTSVYSENPPRVAVDRIDATYVARHGNIEMDTTRGYLKIHMTRVSDLRVGHVSDTIQLHDKSVRAT